VPENLGQHVDRHSVFDGHAGEGVAGAVRKTRPDGILQMAAMET